MRREETYLGGSGGEEVVDLLVDVVGSGEILDSSDLGLNQVVAVNGRRDSSLGETSRHELEDGHLGGGILASDSLEKGQRQGKGGGGQDNEMRRDEEERGRA